MADVMETSLGDPGAPLPLAPILNRCLPGSCLPSNRGTLCWGQDGLLAYGAHSLVVVVDPVTVQTFQCLARHKSPVVALAWGAVEDRRLQLASADSQGEVGSWQECARQILVKTFWSQNVSHKILLRCTVHYTLHSAWALEVY